MPSTPARRGRNPKNAKKHVRTKTSASNKRSSGSTTKETPAPAKSKSKTTAAMKPACKAAEKITDTKSAVKRIQKKDSTLRLEIASEENLKAEEAKSRIPELKNPLYPETYRNKPAEIEKAKNDDANTQRDPVHTGLRFTFDYDLNKGKEPPVESDQNTDDSASISTILAEVGDIFQQSGRRSFDGRQVPSKSDKKTSIVADKKSTGNALRKTMAGIDSDPRRLFDEPGELKREAELHPGSKRSGAEPAPVRGNTSERNLNNPGAEPEDLPGDRNGAEKTSAPSSAHGKIN